MKKIFSIFSLFVLLIIDFAAFAQTQRFPRPEFESGYTQPVASMPEPRAGIFALVDVLLLIAALSLITWFIHRKRSRTGVVITSLFSIVYFGFLREGCVCSVGSVQNVVLALFNPGYHIPLSALAIFRYSVGLYIVFRKNLLCWSMSFGGGTGCFSVETGEFEEMATESFGIDSMDISWFSDSLCSNGDRFYYL